MWVTKILEYDTNKHKNTSHLHNIGEKISIDGKRFLADNSLFYIFWW